MNTTQQENSPQHTLVLLAERRTLLANERNTLAYTRTGIAFILLSLGILEFLNDSFAIQFLGYSALILGLGLIIFGIFYYQYRKKDIQEIHENR